MLDQNNKSHKAAQIIWSCWEKGETIVQLPKELVPKNRVEGYLIQANFERFSKNPLFGWKIAATSTVGQDHIGVSGPLAGRLLKERVFEAGNVLNFGTNKMAVAEPEFAFRMGKTLEPRTNGYNQEEIISAVETLHPGIEFPDSRFHEFMTVGEENLIADNSCAHQFVIGPPMPDLWRSIDLSKHPVKIFNNKGLVHEGKGGNVLGDPRIALTWLVNELSKIDTILHAGATITTGTCAKPLPITSSDAIKADYGLLGQLGAVFA